MKSTKTDGVYVIKIEKGEEVVSNLTNFCKEHDIKNARFDGIGAVEKLECGYYELNTKQYHFQKYDELVEVVSLTGNVMLKDGEPFIHVHGVFTQPAKMAGFTGTENNAFGGHIVEMTVGVVLEVFLTPLSSSIEREHDDCIGLYLMNLDGKQR